MAADHSEIKITCCNSPGLARTAKNRKNLLAGDASTLVVQSGSRKLAFIFMIIASPPRFIGFLGTKAELDVA